MATTDRPAAEPADASSAVADALTDAALVHIVARADGDALAAAGLLAAGCQACDTPYHVGVVRTAAEVEARLAGRDDSATAVVVGADHADALALDPDGPASPLAHDAAATLGHRDPETALAGVVAGGGVPSQVAPTLLAAADLDRVPGVATPTRDLTDGLAHSTLLHAEFSGEIDAARRAMAAIGLGAADATTLAEDDARRIASLVALAAGGAPDATARPASAIERALRPHRTDRPFVTLAGHADVLSAAAERAPGLAVSLAVGDQARDAALEAWRDHGRAAHGGVRGAETSRYAGLLVARTDGPVATVARLLRDFGSPEPTVLAVGAGEAAAASVETPVGSPLQTATAAADGSSLSRRTTGEATFDPDRTVDFVEAFREAVA